MEYTYDIVETNQYRYLYRIESDNKKVKLAVMKADSSTVPFLKLKSLFENAPIPLLELHEAEAMQRRSKKNYQPSWTSIQLSRGKELNNDSQK